MNILFFLTPKEEVAYIYSDDNLRQVLEKMHHHRYSCIPMIDRTGKYVGSITEGDLLWGLKENKGLSLKDTEDVQITSIERRNYYQPVHIETDMEDLIEKAMNQNYVPVVDDKENFIGIITRKDIIGYCYKRMKKLEAEKNIAFESKIT